MKKLRIIAFLAIFFSFIVFAGCGGGGGGTSAPVFVDPTLFVPNYISSLEGLYHWNHLPVRIKFNLPPDWNAIYADNPDLHIDAANDWNQPGKQALTIVVNSNADVTVNFVDKSELSGAYTQGITEFTYDTRNVMHSATIKVAIRDSYNNLLQDFDTQEIIAHEIGHALGIHGHSPNPADLMYQYNTYGVPKHPSARDFNTIMSAYPAYFAARTLSNDLKLQNAEPEPGLLMRAVIE